MNRTIAAVVLVVAAAMAACTSSPSTESPAAQDPNTPTVGSDSGAIRGVVTNNELLPLSDTDVAIRGGQADAVRTDNQGGYQFSQITPGRHVLYFSAIGYQAVARNVDVAVATITELNVRLEPVSSTNPYTALEVKKGFIACGTGAAAVTQVSCGAADANQEFLFTYPVDPHLSGILLELSWKPAQALSKDLLFVAEKQGCGFTCGVDDTFAEITGCCYIRINLTLDQLTKPAGDRPASDFHQASGKIQTRTFPSFQEGTTPVTVFTSQDFLIYAEYFYNGLPDDFGTRSNLPD